MGDGTSKTGPVMAQGLLDTTSFDPAGHDHSKTILLQDEFHILRYDASEGDESFCLDSFGPLDALEVTPTIAYQGIPDDTIIIFDWDDTLLCSSAINMQRWSPSQLEVLQATAESVLRAAARLGEVLIVTNGVEWWVDDSATRFLPGLLPLLKTLTVKSARADWEYKYPGDPFAWKREAFRELLADRGRSTNLLVLGDSLAEIEAAHGVSPLLEDGSLVKTVKFKETPTADQVVGQLRCVALELGDMVQHRAAFRRELVQRDLTERILSIAGCASGWELCETDV